MATALFFFITKIAIKVGQACRSCLPQRHDVFNYSGTYSDFSQSSHISTTIEKLLTKVHSCQSPLCRFEMNQVATREWRKYTFAMYPQERRTRPPLLEYTALEEPTRSSLVVIFARDIVIY